MEKQIIIEMECESTKQGKPYANGIGGTNRQHEIDFNIPYAQNNVFYSLSGGTTLKLITVNEDAVSHVAAGKKYRMTIEEIV